MHSHLTLIKEIQARKTVFLSINNIHLDINSKGMKEALQEMKGNGTQRSSEPMPKEKQCSRYTCVLTTVNAVRLC